MAVEERARTIRTIENVVDLSAAYGDCEGQEPSGQSLRQAHQIRRYSSMLACKHAACTAQTCEDLIGNEQHLVGRAQLVKSLEFAGRVHNHAARTLDERLNDHGRDFVLSGGEELF